MTTEFYTDLKPMLQQVTDMAWLVRRGDDSLGILNRDVQDHYTFISGSNLLKFKDTFEVVEHFGNSELFSAQMNSAIRPGEIYIRGHVVKPEHGLPYVLEPGHPDYVPGLPLYSKNADSNVYYAAGYYCIHFAKWLMSHTPRYRTLVEYGYEGPFRTKEEAKRRIKVLNR